MDANRVSIEAIAACLLVGTFCQLIRLFYRTAQLNYLAYLFIRLVTCAVIIAAIFYLKRGRDIGEFTLVIFAALIGLWIEN